VDIAILDSDLLWTEHSSHALHWINKYTYEDKKQLSIGIKFFKYYLKFQDDEGLFELNYFHV
jgi:hypothetical protein